MTNTDRIEKSIVLRAPRERVWRAISDAQEFGTWHPYAIDPKVDYSQEPTTLVEFRLDDAEGGTRLTVVESGFDRIPAARRAEAFRMNEGGWEEQLKRIQRHVAG